MHDFHVALYLIITFSCFKNSNIIFGLKEINGMKWGKMENNVMILGFTVWIIKNRIKWNLELWLVWSMV